MAGTSAPSTNNLEVDMFCYSVDVPMSLVISRSAGHGTRVMSKRDVSEHHLRQLAPHTEHSMKLRLIMFLKQAQLKTALKGKCRGTRKLQHV